MSYGLWLALAIYATARVFGAELTTRGLASWRELTLLCWSILPVAWLGAKLGGVLDAPDGFLENPLAFLADPEEHAFLGAVGAGLVALSLWCRRNARSIFRVLDALALALPVGYALGRIGCFQAGCCGGLETDLPWAVRPSAAGPAVHPSQLYEALYALASFALLRGLRDVRTRPGALFLVWVALYASGRFLVELVRTNPRYAGLSQAQWLCLVALVAAAALWLRARPPLTGVLHHRGTRAERAGSGMPEGGYGRRPGRTRTR